MHHQKAHIRSAEAERAALPDKLFYKIGEVSRLTGVEPYVLRYWESEFQFLRPRKSKSGQRVYVKKDLETILRIKGLLYDERYTIEGVRKRLGEGVKPEGLTSPVEGLKGPAETSSIENRPTAVAQPAMEGLVSPGRRVSSPHEVLEHLKKRLKELLQNLT